MGTTCALGTAPKRGLLDSSRPLNAHHAPNRPRRHECSYRIVPPVLAINSVLGNGRHQSLVHGFVGLHHLSRRWQTRTNPSSAHHCTKDWDSCTGSRRTRSQRWFRTGRHGTTCYKPRRRFYTLALGRNRSRCCMEPPGLAGHTRCPRRGYHRYRHRCWFRRSSMPPLRFRQTGTQRRYSVQHLGHSSAPRPPRPRMQNSGNCSACSKFPRSSSPPCMRLPRPRPLGAAPWSRYSNRGPACTCRLRERRVLRRSTGRSPAIPAQRSKRSLGTRSGCIRTRWRTS